MNENDIKKLQEAYTLRGIAIHQLHERVSSLEEEIARLKELLQLQQERLFGKKSEISSHVLNPIMPHNAYSTESASILPKTTQVASHARKIPPRGNRQLNTNQLPKYTIIHDLPDAEKKGSCCGGVLHVIGQDKSEQLEIIPVQYCMIEHIRLKYGCRPCDSIVMAPKPEAPIPKAIAGASLLTDVVLTRL
jgi:transposase